MCYHTDRVVASSAGYEPQKANQVGCVGGTHVHVLWAATGSTDSQNEG